MVLVPETMPVFYSVFCGRCILWGYFGYFVRYMACCLLYRGDVVPKDVNSAIQVHFLIVE